jgi:hypothetical protein
MWVRFQNAGTYEASYAVDWVGGQTDRTRVVPRGLPGSYHTASIDLSAYANVGSPCRAIAYIVAGPNWPSGATFVYPDTPPSPDLTVRGITSGGGIQTPNFGNWYWTN